MHLFNRSLFNNKKILLIVVFLQIALAAFAQDPLPKCAVLKLDSVKVDTCIMHATFTNTSIDVLNDDFELDFGDGSPVVVLKQNQSIMHTYLSGNYAVKLTVKSIEGTCDGDLLDGGISFKPINVELRNIPNVFTPNDDGVNDNFLLTNGKTKCVTERMVIYTRWGEKVFESEDREKMFWNGNNGGSEMPAGVYFYVITGQGFKHSGSVTLIR